MGIVAWAEAMSTQQNCGLGVNVMDNSVHFRRCHVCGALTEVSQSKVERCGSCEKSLAPFYYFDDRFVVIPTDSELREPYHASEYRPIRGLTAYWER